MISNKYMLSPLTVLLIVAILSIIDFLRNKNRPRYGLSVQLINYNVFIYTSTVFSSLTCEEKEKLHNKTEFKEFKYHILFFLTGIAYIGEHIFVTAYIHKD